MLKIDALYLLLLIEAVLLLLGAAVLLFLRSRTWKRLALQGPIPISETGERAGQEDIAAADVQEEAVSAREEEPGDQPFSGAPARSSGGEEALRGIVEKQRARILELMCYQDLFEGARNRLSALLDRNDSLSAMLGSLQDADDFSLRRDEMLGELQMSSGELASYIEVLGRENEKLAAKFRTWEDELRQAPVEKGE